MVSSVVVGSFTPCIVPLVLGRVHELVSHSTERRRATWSHATSFALFQSGAACGFPGFMGTPAAIGPVRTRWGRSVLALAIDLVLALTARKVQP